MPELYAVYALLYARAYNDFDISIRKFTRELLHLPHDVPNTFFYASISDGGLGLILSRWRGPLMRRNKLRFFARNFGGFSESVRGHIAAASDAATNLLSCNNSRFDSGKQIAEFFRTSLHRSYDGRDLDLSGDIKDQNSWLFRPNGFICGRDFINFNKLRINALPLRFRLTRGTRAQEERMCRRGCHLTETTYHTIPYSSALAPTVGAFVVTTISLNIWLLITPTIEWSLMSSLELLPTVV